MAARGSTRCRCSAAVEREDGFGINSDEERELLFGRYRHAQTSEGALWHASGDARNCLNAAALLPYDRLRAASATASAAFFSSSSETRMTPGPSW